MTNFHPALGALEILVCLTGILGNGVTLFVVTKRKIFANRQNFDIFLGNLAVVDLMPCIFSPLIIGTRYAGNSIMQNEFLCAGNLLIGWLIRPLALLSLTLLTLNRFYAVRMPSTSIRVFNKRRSWWYVCSLWSSEILLMTLAFLYAIKSSPGLNITSTCSLLGALVKKLKQFRFAFIFINLVIMSFCNVRIWQFIKSHNRRIAEQNVLPEEIIKARNIKLAKMMIPVFLSYIIISLFPSVILAFSPGHKSDVSISIMIILYTVNHANNFFIYVASNKNFRKEVKKIFSKSSPHEH